MGVDENEAAVHIPPKFAGVTVAEIIEDVPQGPEDGGEEPIDETPTDAKVTLTREELVNKGVLPPKGEIKRRPLAEAVTEQVKKVVQPEAPVQETAQPTQEQVSGEYQQQILQHHSQQGAIALELIKAMLANDNIGLKTNADKLVERAYAITDSLQKTLDARHQKGLLDAFVTQNKKD